jgi:hypothetical protein
MQSEGLLISYTNPIGQGQIFVPNNIIEESQEVQILILLGSHVLQLDVGVHKEQREGLFTS